MGDSAPRRSPRKGLRQTTLFEGFGAAQPKRDKAEKRPSGLIEHPLKLTFRPGKSPKSSAAAKAAASGAKAPVEGPMDESELSPASAAESKEDEAGPVAGPALAARESAVAEQPCTSAAALEASDADIVEETDEEDLRSSFVSTTPDMEQDESLPASPPPEEAWLGAPLASLPTWGAFQPSLPPLKASADHAVLFKVAGGEAQPSKPFPAAFRDVWDSHHVRMPCSAKNKFPGTGTSRWAAIQEALSRDFASSLDFEDAVRAYNQGARWSFAGLHKFFTEHLSQEEAQLYLGTVLPATAQLALRLPDLVTQPLPLLQADREKSVTLSQEQAAALLANALFSTFPRRHLNSHEYRHYNAINFARLYGLRSDVNMAKLRCLFHYFHRVTQAMPQGSLTFSRRVRGKASRVPCCLSSGDSSGPDWAASEAQLTPLHVAQRGTIEDDGVGLTQLDFANKYLGGGVLGHGAVQEEIRFMVCPELLLSCLLTEVLGPREALVMRGGERFSSYGGYARSFRWAGDFADGTPRDGWGRRRVEVLAIDAVCFAAFRVQFMPRFVLRELDKAWAGFADGAVEGGDGLGPGLATGNWGCGAFGGDVQLKGLLQLMAAAEAHRPLAYFTFGDGRLMKALADVHGLATARKASVGRLFRIAQLYYEEEVAELDQGRPKTKLFAFLKEKLEGEQ